MSIRSRIECNNDILLDTMDWDSQVVEAKYSGSFSDRIADGKLDITLLPSHPLFASVNERTSTIRACEYLSNDSEYELFHGRVISKEIDIYHRLKLTCECDAKFMEDVPDLFSMTDGQGAQLGDDVKKVTFRSAVETIFKTYGDTGADTYGYNSYAAPSRKIYLAPFPSTVPDFWNKEIDKPSAGSSVYSNLKSWLEKVDAYAKMVRYQNGQGTYGDYYILSITETKGGEDDSFYISFGENVTDYKLQRGTENFFTGVHAIGKNDSSLVVPDDDYLETGYSLGDGQTALSDGTVVPANVIYHAASANTYGLITFHQEVSKDGDSSLTAEDVTIKGIAALKEKMKLYETLDISVIDPRLIGYDENSVPVLGAAYLVQIPIVSNREPLTKFDKDFLNPDKTKMTFGDKKNLLSDRSKTALSAANVAMARASAAATPAQVAEAIASNATESVEDLGDETTRWYIRKWASGDAECWTEFGVAIPQNGMTQTGDLYYYDSSVAFPTDLFQSTPQLHVSPGRNRSGNYLFWTARHNNSTSTTAHFTIMRASPVTTNVTLYANLYAFGRWK